MRSTRRDSQRGSTLIEVIIAVAVLSAVVLATADGMLSDATASKDSQSRQRLNSTLTSYSETLKLLPYKRCADAAWYEAQYNNLVAGVSSAEEREALFGTIKVDSLKVESVKYWSAGNYQATGTTVPGSFVTSCLTDAGAQQLSLVAIRGKQKSALQLVKRDPLALEFVDYASVAVSPPSGNLPPTASFTATPTSGSAPLLVALDASASDDPDGTLSSFTWITDGAAPVTTTGPTHTMTLTSGTFLITLQVTDSDGAKASRSRTLVVSGKPAAPSGLKKVRSGCCTTYGNFSWNAVPGVQEYEVYMEGFFGGGCVTDHSARFVAPATTGQVVAIGLCLGSRYDIRIRARAGAVWSDWSPTTRITL